MSKAYLKPNLILIYPYLIPLTTLDLLEGFEENGGTDVRTDGRSDIVTTWAAVAANKNITKIYLDVGS